MDDIRPEILNRLLETPDMLEISPNPPVVDSKVLADHTLLLQCIHLLRDERGIFTILATSDYQYFHQILKQSSAT